eukprot:6181243-Pleurochrysis_carterae.AAC.2
MPEQASGEESQNGLWLFTEGRDQEKSERARAGERGRGERKEERGRERFERERERGRGGEISCERQREGKLMARKRRCEKAREREIPNAAQRLRSHSRAGLVHVRACVRTRLRGRVRSSARERASATGNEVKRIRDVGRIHSARLAKATTTETLAALKQHTTSFRDRESVGTSSGCVRL